MHVNVNDELISIDIDAKPFEYDIPEKALLRALLVRAMLDYTKCLMKRGNSQINPQSQSRDAGRWFESESREDFSFIWVCDALGLDAPLVLREIRQVKGRRTTRYGNKWFSLKSS